MTSLFGHGISTPYPAQLLPYSLVFYQVPRDAALRLYFVSRRLELCQGYLGSTFPPCSGSCHQRCPAGMGGRSGHSRTSRRSSTTAPSTFKYPLPCSESSTIQPANTPISAGRAASYSPQLISRSGITGRDSVKALIMEREELPGAERGTEAADRDGRCL